MISVELILATRPAFCSGYGLATFVVNVPVYIWTELLTHKRLCRNASSSRAQKFARHQGHGYYTPPVFYSQGDFMQSGDPLPDDVQEELRAFWEEIHNDVYERIRNKLGALQARGYTWANEQVNRLLPTTKFIRGILTATEDAWRKMLELRAHETADKAMQELAHKMQAALASVIWREAAYHIPFDAFPGSPESEQDYYTRALIAAARLARVSNGAPGEGRRSDEALATYLLQQRHLSPFEHIAHWVEHPLTSALCSKPEDMHHCANTVWGWQNIRAELENQLNLV